MVKREAATTVSHEEAARIAIPIDYILGDCNNRLAS